MQNERPCRKGRAFFLKMKVDGVKIDFEVYPTLGGSTPARCRIEVPRKRATVKLAQDLLNGKSKEEIIFTILHEIAHAVLNTSDERACDRWAFRQYAKGGYSMKKAVFAISKQLDPVGNGEHSDRTVRQFYRAKHQNFLNGNTSWKKFLTQKI